MADLLERIRAALTGRYSVERELGRGGMATVFLAEDPKHHRPVAIKVLDPALAGLLGPERFVREIETAARLQHPHILPLLDSGAEQGLLYYVMPYVAGDTLRTRLTRERQLPQDEAIRLASAVARALDYAHRQSIVHRDIKPENVLLADGEAMIADFGIAAAIQSSGGEKLTQSGLTVGTPPYMSPEQVAGRADLDGRSDLYSLGCVLYELLVGQGPFTGPTETLAHQHLTLTPRPIRELRPAISPELAAVVARSLAKLPADRFATGAELAAALAAAPRATTLETGLTPASAPAGPRVSTSAGTEVLPAPGAAREGAETGSGGARARGGASSRRFALVALAGVAVIAAAGLWWRSVSRGPASEGGAHRRWVWLADFDGPASDATLAPAARDLVAASFEASKELATVPPEQVKIALRNSGRSDSTRVDAALARELAYRSAIPVVVHGTVGSIGSAYQIVLRASKSEDGSLLETASGQATSERELVPVLTRLARDLRRALGERPEAFRGTESWADAPTPSFEAFKLYRRGRELINRNDDWGALPLLRQAVAIDSEFATAWAYLGTAHGNLGNDDSALAARTEALRHPHRLPPARRMYIGAFEAEARGDASAALAAYDAILQLNPSPVDRMAALNNRASILMGMGRFGEALGGFREAAGALPIQKEPINSLNIANVLLAMNRVPEAREEIARESSGVAAAARMEIHVIERSWDAAESIAVAMEARPGGPSLQARFRFGHAAARSARGDLGKALRLLNQLASELELPRALGVQWLSREALSRRTGLPPPPIPARTRGTRWGAMAEAVRAAHSGDSAAARRAVASWPASEEGASRAVLADYVESCLEGRRGHWEEVVRRIGPAARRGSRDIPNAERALRPSLRWLMADAFEGLGQPDSAAAYLDLILSPPAYEPGSIPGVGFWEPFVRARLVGLLARSGHIDDARRQWQILSETCTQPDEHGRRLLDETLAVLQASEGMRAPERR